MRETVFVKLRVSDYFSKTTVYSSAGEYLSYFIQTGLVFIPQEIRTDPSSFYQTVALVINIFTKGIDKPME